MSFKFRVEPGQGFAWQESGKIQDYAWRTLAGIEAETPPSVDATIQGVYLLTYADFHRLLKAANKEGK